MMMRKVLFGVITIAATISAGAIINAKVGSFSLKLFSEQDTPKAPVDWGYGPGAGIGPARPNFVLGETPLKASTIIAPTTPGGTIGFFGPPTCWPIIPLHMVLLPNGQVLTYGTYPGGGQPNDSCANFTTPPQGQLQGGFVYDIWNPNLGTGQNAHSTLPNKTSADIFCSAASLLKSGEVLITGGDLPTGGVRGYSNNLVELFNQVKNTLTATAQMRFPRWYATIVPLQNGDKLELGGRWQFDGTNGVIVPTPEVYVTGTASWRSLSNITLADKFDGAGGNFSEWYYPRAYHGSDGAVYLLNNNSQIFGITTDGTGTMTDVTAVTTTTANPPPPGGCASACPGYSCPCFFPGRPIYPTLMLDPFKVLAVRFPGAQQVQLVDLSKVNLFSNPPVGPVVSNLAPLLADNLNNPSADRLFANTTLLANGEVLVTGGSGVYNCLTDDCTANGKDVTDKQAEIFNPPNNSWRLDAPASKPRLYHSATLLLPDGSVLTGGGGSPGPINEANVEIYYPPYLYQSDGSRAPRPTIFSAPKTLKRGQTFSFTVGSKDIVGSVSLIRLGTNTHNFNAEQRRIPLTNVKQNGSTVTATLDPSALISPQGWYMLFVFNTAGTPAVAKTVFVCSLSCP